MQQTALKTFFGKFARLAVLVVSILASYALPAQAQEAPLLRIYDYRDAAELPLRPDAAQLIHALDMEGLRALPQMTFTTKTNWTEGQQVFEGVPLKAMLKWLDLSSGQLVLIAQNDYQVRLSIAEALEQDGLLAYKRNGETMSLRDKGPIWLVYPYDRDQVYRSETIYAQSVWQLDRLMILR